MNNRRELLLGLMMALGGSTALARAHATANADQMFRRLGPPRQPKFYGNEDLQLLGIIADAIIPRTDTPGAIDAGVPRYVDAMLAAWASDRTRREQRQAFAKVRARLHELGGRELRLLPDAERRTAIARLDAEAYQEATGAVPGGVAAAYRALKSLIAQVYYATEIGAMQELQYELVPGRWLADAPLTQIGRTWAF